MSLETRIKNVVKLRQRTRTCEVAITGGIVLLAFSLSFINLGPRLLVYRFGELYVGRETVPIDDRLKLPPNTYFGIGRLEYLFKQSPSGECWWLYVPLEYVGGVTIITSYFLIRCLEARLNRFESEVRE